jgi:3',5'-cyclic-AMP phosphodiesterase
MTRPLLIAQISDLHIKAPGALAYGKVDTAAALSRCIAALNCFTPRPDFVVISGDLADTPTEEEYRHIETLLTPLTIPYSAIPGNHDDRALMRAMFANGAFATADALNSMHSVDGLDLLLADSSVPGHPYGLLDAPTLSWLDEQLASSAERPALLFLHHPPFVTGIGHMDVQNLRNADALHGLLVQHPRVRLVASGHVHRSVFTSFAGRPATICPAPNHAVALDLDAHWPPSFMVEPPAFHLHVWTAGSGFGDVVTHTVPIGDFDGPHPFFDAGGKLL